MVARSSVTSSRCDAKIWSQAAAAETLDRQFLLAELWTIDPVPAFMTGVAFISDNFSAPDLPASEPTNILRHIREANHR
jgi:hypothetical protein